MTNDIVMFLGALCFGFLTMVVIATVMVKRGRSWGQTSSRLIALTAVSTVVLALTVSQISLERLIAAFGLLGTIAGYLLARRDNEDDEARTKKKPEGPGAPLGDR